MQKKIRTAQQQKIPFMVIAGDDDVAAGTVSFRYRDGSQRNGVPLAEAAPRPRGGRVPIDAPARRGVRRGPRPTPPVEVRPARSDRLARFGGERRGS